MKNFPFLLKSLPLKEGGRRPAGRMGPFGAEGVAARLIGRTSADMPLISPLSCFSKGEIIFILYRVICLKLKLPSQLLQHAGVAQPGST